MWNPYKNITPVTRRRLNNFKKNRSFNGVILFGNESHGISKNLSNYVDQWLSIKKIGEAESLNVAVATGIILNQLTND